MDNLTPITREEMLMNNEPLTPITREEKILAGEDLNPVTRREYFLKKYRHAGGDVMVEGLSVTANGTYTAPEGKAYSPVEVAVPLPENAYLLKTASGSLVSFSDGADLPIPSFVCDISAVQDLHGYDSPWVGGAGKNKLKYPYYASSTTINEVTFTVNDDGTVKVNGTATADASFYLSYTGSDMVLPQGEYTLNGCPSGGSNTTYMLNITNVSTQDTGSGANFTSDGTISLNIRIIVRANTTASNLLFKPMIRLASVQDATFAPYSNVCPISGWDECNVTRCGKNLLAKTFTHQDNTTTNLSEYYFLKKGKYTVAFDSIGTATSWRFLIRLKDKNGNDLSDSKYAIPGMYYASARNGWMNNANINAKETNIELIEDCYVRILFCLGDTTSSMTATNARLNIGSVAQNYEAYNGHTYTIDLDGTRYGGTLDVVSGVLTVDRGYVDLGDLSQPWGYVSNGNRFTNNSLVSLIKTPSTDEIAVEAITSQLKVLSLKDLKGSSNDALFAVGDTGIISIRYTSCGTDIEAIKTALTGVELVYKLATPITYQLTPTQIKSLLGNNNAWCSTGDVDIDYFAKEVTG